METLGRWGKLSIVEFLTKYLNKWKIILDSTCRIFPLLAHRSKSKWWNDIPSWLYGESATCVVSASWLFLSFDPLSLQGFHSCASLLTSFVPIHLSSCDLKGVCVCRLNSKRKNENCQICVVKLFFYVTAKGRQKPRCSCNFSCDFSTRSFGGFRDDEQLALFMFLLMITRKPNNGADNKCESDFPCRFLPGGNLISSRLKFTDSWELFALSFCDFSTFREHSGFVLLCST